MLDMALGIIEICAFLVAGFLAMLAIKYQFAHPELTQTQLLIELWRYYALIVVHALIVLVMSWLRTNGEWWAPDCLTVWRKFVGNEEGRIDEKPTIRESAVWYLDQYSAEVETAARNMGLSVGELLTGIDFVESLNETIPTFNPGQLQRAVEFDVRFAEEVHRRYGTHQNMLRCRQWANAIKGGAWNDSKSL